MLTIMPAALESLIWETRRLFRALSVAADHLLEPLGISASDRALIEFLARETEPISLAELARKRSVSRQHIHQSLARLRNPAWIEKTTDPNDARSLQLRLTDEGHRLWGEIRAIDKAFLRRLARQVDIAGAQQAANFLHRVRNAVEGYDHD
jgi:MarR family transcriptional regulator for hemolysin